MQFVSSSGHELTDQRFAENLRVIREDRRMSQAELARQMKGRGWPYHQQTVHKVEAGARKVGLGEAKDLAEILGTSVDRLTWPTREASLVEVLNTAASRARAAVEQIAIGTRSLAAARRQLELSLAEAERAESPRVQDAAAEAREALRLSAEAAAAAAGEPEEG